MKLFLQGNLFGPETMRSFSSGGSTPGLANDLSELSQAGASAEPSDNSSASHSKMGRARNL